MTKCIGVGGSTSAQALAKLRVMNADVAPVPVAEFQARIARAQALMQAQGIAAIYLNAGTNLYYFTGMKWYASERMVGAILPAQGELQFIGPAFEENTLNEFMLVPGTFHGWQEHESPYALFGQVLAQIGYTDGLIGLDESASFFITDGIAKACSAYRWCNADVITAGCRMQKSELEIALMQRAKDMTIEVHKAAASI